MKELVRHLHNVIEREKILLKDDAVVFPGHFGETIPFSAAHFHCLTYTAERDNGRDNGRGNEHANFGTLSFIDGGDATLLQTASFSVHLIRAYGSVYKGREKQLSTTMLYGVLVQTVIDQGVQAYKAACFPLSKASLLSATPPSFPETFFFKPAHESLRQGASSASPSAIGGIVRRYLELHLAAELCKAIPQGMLVLDGSLQRMYEHDEVFFSSLLQAAEASSVTVLAVSKTSELRTKQGRSVLGLLHYHSPKGAWFYYPVLSYSLLSPMKEQRGLYQGLFDLCFVKWHQASKHVFRVDLWFPSHNSYDAPSEGNSGIASGIVSINHVSDHISQVQTALSSLLWNAADPLFPGYPYGLLEADQFARVSHEEQQYYQVVLSSLLSKDAPSVEMWGAATNAHSILDTTRF
ncbi:hypothetical protein HYS47_02050 [Candidatus Woesearchaeota archaeon]|nr:hypothetical protein [Candidatus Woesearchaeota archaeon]